MRNFEFFKISSNIQAPGGGLLGENNKTTSYTCTIHFCIKWYQVCKKNNEQKLNGKVISKSEDNGFLWPQPEAISSERDKVELWKILKYV